MKCKLGTDATVHIHFYSFLPQPSRSTLDVHYVWHPWVLSSHAKEFNKNHHDGNTKFRHFGCKGNRIYTDLRTAEFPLFGTKQNTFFLLKKDK